MDIATGWCVDARPEAATPMAKYAPSAGEKVARALHERKAGTLKSGRSGRKVKSRKQAIAIGLAEARRAGARVPPARAPARRKPAGKRAAASSKTTGRSR